MVDFFLTCLVDGGPLCYAVIVALPHDIGIGREGQDALDSLPTTMLM